MARSIRERGALLDERGGGRQWDDEVSRIDNGQLPVQVINPFTGKVQEVPHGYTTRTGWIFDPEDPKIIMTPGESAKPEHWRRAGPKDVSYITGGAITGTPDSPENTDTEIEGYSTLLNSQGDVVSIDSNQRVVISFPEHRREQIERGELFKLSDDPNEAKKEDYEKTIMREEVENFTVVKVNDMYQMSVYSGHGSREEAQDKINKLKSVSAKKGEDVSKDFYYVVDLEKNNQSGLVQSRVDSSGKEQLYVPSGKVDEELTHNPLRNGQPITNNFGEVTAGLGRQGTRASVWERLTRTYVPVAEGMRKPEIEVSKENGQAYFMGKFTDLMYTGMGQITAPRPGTYSRSTHEVFAQPVKEVVAPDDKMREEKLNKIMDDLGFQTAEQRDRYVAINDEAHAESKGRNSVMPIVYFENDDGSREMLSVPKIRELRQQGVLDRFFEVRKPAQEVDDSGSVVEKKVAIDYEWRVPVNTDLYRLTSRVGTELFKNYDGQPTDDRQKAAHDKPVAMRGDNRRGTIDGKVPGPLVSYDIAFAENLSVDPEKVKFNAKYGPANAMRYPVNVALEEPFKYEQREGGHIIESAMSMLSQQGVKQEPYAWTIVQMSSSYAQNNHDIKVNLQNAKRNLEHLAKSTALGGATGLAIGIASGIVGASAGLSAGDAAMAGGGLAALAATVATYTFQSNKKSTIETEMYNNQDQHIRSIQTLDEYRQQHEVRWAGLIGKGGLSNWNDKTAGALRLAVNALAGRDAWEVGMRSKELGVPLERNAAEAQNHRILGYATALLAGAAVGASGAVAAGVVVAGAVAIATYVKTFRPIHALQQGEAEIASAETMQTRPKVVRTSAEGVNIDFPERVYNGGWSPEVNDKGKIVNNTRETFNREFTHPRTDKKTSRYIGKLAESSREHAKSQGHDSGGGNYPPESRGR